MPIAKPGFHSVEPVARLVYAPQVTSVLPGGMTPKLLSVTAIATLENR